MRSPQPGLVFVDTVVLADFFRVAHALERAHVLARACDKRSIDVGINVEHALHDVFLLVEFAQFKLMVRRVRGEEVAPGVGRILDRLHRGGGNALLLFGKKMFVEIRFRIHACFMAFIKHVERIEVGIFWIDAIRGEASAQAIAAIVHERDGLQNVAAVMARARLVHDAGNGASGGNAHVAFTQAAAVKRACAGCRLLRRFSIVHAAPHFPHWPNPGNSRRGGLVATGAWRCAAPQGLGSECSVSRVWVQRFTSVTRVLQRSVMCVSKALTPHEEHGGSTYGDRGKWQAPAVHGRQRPKSCIQECRTLDEEHYSIPSRGRIALRAIPSNAAIAKPGML